MTFASEKRKRLKKDIPLHKYVAPSDKTKGICLPWPFAEDEMKNDLLFVPKL